MRRALLHKLCGSGWLRGQPASQRSSWAPEHPGKQSEGGKQRSLVAGKSRETLEGSHSHEKCQVSDFSSCSRRKYITCGCGCMNVSLSIYMYVKKVYIYVKKGYIYIYFYVYDTYFKMLFLVRNKILIPSGCNELLLSSAMKFLSRQLEAKIREANFREPS